MRRMRFYDIAIGMMFLGFVGGIQAQETYPTRPIELVVPFGAGGTADVAALAK